MLIFQFSGNTHIEAVQELIKFLLAKLLAFLLKLGLKCSNPLIVVVVRPDCGHVVGIAILKSTEGLANGCKGPVSVL